MKTSHRLEFIIFGTIIGILLSYAVQKIFEQVWFDLFSIFAVFGLIYFLYVSLTRYWRTQQ